MGTRRGLRQWCGLCISVCGRQFGLRFSFRLVADRGYTDQLHAPDRFDGLLVTVLSSDFPRKPQLIELAHRGVAVSKISHSQCRHTPGAAPLEGYLKRPAIQTVANPTGTESGDPT